MSPPYVQVGGIVTKCSSYFVTSLVGLGALGAQRHLDRLPLAVPVVVESDLLAGLPGEEGLGVGLDVAKLLAVEGEEDVPFLQTGLLRGAPGRHAGQLDALPV